jgi:hypothetical protein
MHSISNLFYFGTIYVSDGLSVHYQESKTVHTASGICTVLNSWWWTERPSEACRELFQNKINLRYCAAGWFYYRKLASVMSPYRVLNVTSVTNVPLTSVIAQEVFHNFFSKITYRILYNLHLLKLNSNLPSNKTPVAGDSLVSKGG